MEKKILVLGATGSMGHYLTQKLAADGHRVDGVSLDKPESKFPNLRYIQTPNAKDPAFIQEITKNHYDAIVDFMTYPTVAFRETFPKFCSATDQYVFISSCRVYANEENPIRENSPRLLDVSSDPEYLFSDDYSLYKARSENALRASKFKNWTIVRPSTTYGRKIWHLLTLNRNQLVPCVKENRPALLYEGAKNIPASLTWGGDVAEMIKRLLFKEEALCNDYNVTSNESLTWEEIARINQNVFGLKVEWVDEETYYRFRDGYFDPKKSLPTIWQLRYARMFNRIYDTTKILNATGLSQEDFLTLAQGLEREKPTILGE